MPQLPDELKAFVLEHVDSVEQLEVLLLLRERRDRCWTAVRSQPGASQRYRSPLPTG